MFTMIARNLFVLPCALLLLLLCVQSVGSTIVTDPSYVEDDELILYIDPPNGHISPAALGVFVRSNDPDAVVYWEVFATGSTPVLPSLESLAPLTYDTPYIELDTPFKASRNRTLIVVAVVTDPEGNTRSKQITLDYVVEGSARPNSYGFLVPGIESGGYFVRYGVEIAATARAQVAGGQEFADFFTNLGIGTYDTQIQAINLLELDPDLTGFEGGFPYNTSGHRHYGILIPYHNGNDFFGKVVRVDLQAMKNASVCATQYWFESYDRHGVVHVNKSVTSKSHACVTVLDLRSKYPDARGFRKGFVNYPYGYLSAGHFSTVARLDLETFSLSAVRLVDLSYVDKTYGGYSGGFKDGSWACFNPYLSYAGPIGGIRSQLPVDAHHLRPYYYSNLLCLNETAWGMNHSDTASLTAQVRTIDFSTIEDSLRGFSEALRVGRFAYLSPLSSAEGVYSSKLIRISLGEVDIGTTLTELASSGINVRTIVDILDLSKKSTSLAGYSGLFTAGKRLFLCPFRNTYEPKNGQRGHGTLTRLDMNSFNLQGVDFLDIPTTIRTQVPSFPDFKLRGFAGGFASGYYGMLVPFFNADFNGIIARFKTIDDVLDGNLQELDLMEDRLHPDTYRGFRGGFPSLWKGVNEPG